MDAHGDDLDSCGPGAILTLACGDALADDDDDASDNRLSRNAFRRSARPAADGVLAARYPEAPEGQA